MTGKDNKRIAATINVPSQAYGELREDLHFAGYAFERGCQRLRKLLSDDSWKQCGGGFSNVEDFLNSLQLDQLAKVAAERREIAKLIKALRPEVSTRAIGRALKVAHTTVVQRAPQKAKNTNADNDVVVRDAPTLSGAAAAAVVKRREDRKERDQAAAEKTISIDGEGSIALRHGDFRTAFRDLRDLDAIITDPPYGEQYLHLLHDLATFADSALKPGGILAVLYGQTHLPAAFAQLAGGRPYRWTACYLTEGPGYVSHARELQSNWKPLLIYGGGPRFVDVFRAMGDGAAKELHSWGQSFEAFHSIIDALTVPGAAIADPFADNRPGRSGCTRHVRWLGVHMLQLSADRPDKSDRIVWDGKLDINEATLIELLRFDRDPDHPKRFLDTRRHHSRPVRELHPLLQFDRRSGA